MVSFESLLWMVRSYWRLWSRRAVTYAINLTMRGVVRQPVASLKSG